MLTAARRLARLNAANVLSLSLDSSVDQLSEHLNEVLTEHIDGIFRRPGELGSAENFMDGWLAAIEDAAGQEA
ncbi:hypothetical protein ACTU45_29930 [Streptomyces sp. 24-1644]|uniref:hypothetical protein n=1 Tax=Streptomyces sp. 24-1644 TaxID=3457315 RepID=UPI003FA75153